MFAQWNASARKIEKHKEARRHLINLRVQKMINIRFPQSHVSIVNLVNWKEVDYASSVISRCWNGVGFSSAESSFPLGKVLPFSGKNAKFSRRATTFWLEYAAEEKENRKRTAKVWETYSVGVDSVKRATVSFSLNPTTEIFYFPLPSYARFKGTEGDCRELMGKMEQKEKHSRVALNLFDSHWAQKLRG